MGVVPQCIYCVVCYCVISAPYVRSVGYVFAYLYTLDDDSERPMDCETYLFPQVFPYVGSNNFVKLQSLIIEKAGFKVSGKYLYVQEDDSFPIMCAF